MTGRPGCLVLAIGNPSRGDDAAGPLLAERLQVWLGAHGHAADVEVVTDFQLAPEHVLDLEGRRAVLLVDAAESGPDTALTPVAAAGDWSYTSHQMSPPALLQACLNLGVTPPRSVELLAIRGEDFELGQPLTAAAERNLGAAWGCARQWCERHLTPA